MQLKKFMHQRNIYREPINFNKLAVLYPEFQKIAFTDIAGKVKIHWKDEESLRVLIKTLLKHDFQLDVQIPPNNLVPTLALRLNYILWIEDLLNHSGIKDMSSVKGIDIGTGAICIYPLLMCKMFNCKMICSEINEDSVNSANSNIKRNNFQELITVKQVNKDTIFKEIIKEDEKYSFVMCNPPFFDTDNAIEKKSKKNPPRNAPTGNKDELEVEGGETEFVSRLIDDSIIYKNQVKIYSTMIGKRKSLPLLVKLLKEKGITNCTWTEFCQGFTKRWGIAWSFAIENEIDLQTAPVIRIKNELPKVRDNKPNDKPVDIVFPPNGEYKCISDISRSLENWFNELNIEMQLIDTDCDSWVIQLNAYENTWSHARKKRRMEMRDNNEIKKPRLTDDQNDTDMHKEDGDETKNDLPEAKDASSSENRELLLACNVIVGENLEDPENEVSDNDNDDIERLLYIRLIYEGGSGGKMCLQTLHQYLINKLNVRETLVRSKASKAPKKKRKSNNRNYKR